MKVKCVKEYYDLQLKKTVKVGEELEVTAARGKELTTVNNKAGVILCEEVATPTTTEKVVKKATKKKEA